MVTGCGVLASHMRTIFVYWIEFNSHHIATAFRNKLQKVETISK